LPHDAFYKKQLAQQRTMALWMVMLLLSKGMLA